MRAGPVETLHRARGSNCGARGAVMERARIVIVRAAITRMRVESRDRLYAYRQTPSERRPDRPKVAAAGQRPDQDEEDDEQGIDSGVDP